MTLSTDEKAQLFTHLATMENAGMPALQSFQQLRLKPKYMERVANCRRAISKGSDIAHAAYSAKLFDYFEFTLVRAACTAGSPSLSYKRLAQVYQERARLEKRLRSRMRLPLLMLIFALSIPRIPALVLGTISFLQFMLGIIVPLLLIYLIVKLFKQRLQRTAEKPSKSQSGKTDDGFDRFLLKLPIFGRMILRDNARQFYEALSLLLEAGVPMFEAVPLAKETIWNNEIRPHYSAITKQLEQGWTLAQALENNEMRGEDAVIELVRTGEASGTLPALLWRHVEAETGVRTQFREELATWLPKIIYGLVACYIIIQIFKSGAFSPHLPDEAR